MSNNTTVFDATTQSSMECPDRLILPVKGTEDEVNHSLKILLMFFVIAICFLEIYLLLRSRFHYIPESFLVVVTGAAVGGSFAVIYGHLPGDFEKKEAFDPTTFFLFLLPPIIYESAYNLHKGNFFKNIGSILIFALVGTAVSAFVIGGSLFLLGKKGYVYELSFTEGFAFGAFLSAVDPVATLAVFHALEVEPVLNMLVIGESVLNDAVAVVLSSTVWEASKNTDVMDYTISYTILVCALRFALVFLASASVGVVFGLMAALLFKHVALRRYPSLEFGMMLIFIYVPFCVADVLNLSGILTILFNGIVMSHYTHFNLSRFVQHTMQVTLRSVAFISETCVFAYLGLSIFSFQITLDIAFISVTLVLCLAARAVNIFPLCICVNFFRTHKITPKMMFIMWFSAIRGAVCFALSLRFEFEEKKRNVIITTTLVIVLFTTIVFGGSTMPLLKCLQKRESRTKKDEDCHSEICLIKTEKLGETIDAEQVTGVEGLYTIGPQSLFLKLDAKYLQPFFTRQKNSHQGSECGSRLSQDFDQEWYNSAQPCPCFEESQ
ncbi:hypothetical protein JTE90_007524 [Oedothorax gibbosus]|uniref:Sodium/hydrogen exchanger n=1 Tax=Oedothorax gibbosus TaxID=931172 RepID=A0AAV6VKE6_9ARAC|nr:hypothetical protein JTE90_007524 [Oedothorax gibbosus]